MANVDDIANYILRRRSMTAMKLQKLVYYAQAWHLVKTDEPLFDAPIEAWANGPVVPDLYRTHRGQFSLGSWPKGDAEALTAEEQETVDLVLETYGLKGAQWLSEQTHSEGPWLEAREGIPVGRRSSTSISQATMRAFYSTAQDTGRGPLAVVERP